MTHLEELRLLDIEIATRYFGWLFVTNVWSTWFSPPSALGTKIAGITVQEASMSDLEFLEEDWWSLDSHEEYVTVPLYSTEAGAAFHLLAVVSPDSFSIHAGQNQEYVCSLSSNAHASAKRIPEAIVRAVLLLETSPDYSDESIAPTLGGRK